MVWKKEKKTKGDMERKQRGGEELTLPTPRHTHTPCTRSLYRGCTWYDNEGMHKVLQVCYRPTKKNRGERRGMRTHRPPSPRISYTVHALSIGESRKVRRRGMLSRTLREKKRNKA